MFVTFVPTSCFWIFTYSSDTISTSLKHTERFRMATFPKLTVGDLPFNKSGKFYRGNLHGHSTESDGHWTPDEYIRQYRQNGYDFVALTDHFMKQFDYPLVDTRHYHDESFTTLIGAELHHGYTRFGGIWHLLAVGLPLDFAPYSEDETAADVVKRAVDSGAFFVVAHPNWYTLTVEDFESLGKVHAVECYNGQADRYNDRGNSWHFIDMVTQLGHRVGAIAVDDLHMHDGLGDFMRGWVQVKAPELTPAALLDALKTGHYYASTGPQLYNVEVIGKEKIIVECSPAQHILINTPKPWALRVDGHGLTHAEFDISQHPLDYFRVTVIDQHRNRAWTNYVWIED